MTQQTFRKTMFLCFSAHVTRKSIRCTKALPLIGLTRFTGITKLIVNANITNVHFYVIKIYLKECMSDSVTNYNYVGNTKISVSIKKANANKCTLS